MTDLAHEVPLAPGLLARVRFTAAADGDFAVGDPGPDLDARRRRVADLPWTWLHQEHGAGVVVVEVPGEHAGAHADAAVTRITGAVLAVHTADCAPVVLLGRQGAVAAVHAGWRGLAAGVVERAVRVLDEMGAGQLQAIVGPCIGPECYEFGAADLDGLAGRFGDGVRARTAEGRPALDLPAAVTAALARVGVADVRGPGPCTACGEPKLHSHRARGDVGRQATVVWLAQA